MQLRTGARPPVCEWGLAGKTGRVMLMILPGSMPESGSIARYRLHMSDQKELAGILPDDLSGSRLQYLHI